MENTHILRGFRECNQRKWPFLQASTQYGIPKRANHAHNQVFLPQRPLQIRIPDRHFWFSDAIMIRQEKLILSCAICEIRKEKRFCPAIHGRICPQCCGEQREVTLDCPSECPYLQQARQHEKPRVAGDFDPASLFLQVEIPDQFTYEHEHLLMGLSYALFKAASADRALNDRDLIDALSAMSTSYERRVNSSLHYQEPLTGSAQRTIVVQVEEMIRQYRQAEQQHLGQSSLRDSDLLKALVFLLRLAHSRTNGRPKSRAFVDFLSAQFPEKEPALIAPQDSGSRIIVP